MTAPSNAQYQNGVSQVTGDQLNTFLQGVTVVTSLRAFVGVVGMTIYLQGITTSGDGGAGAFWWNPASVAADDGVNVIVPPGASSGAWNRLAVASAYTYISVTGTPSVLITPIGQSGSTAYSSAAITQYTSRSTDAEFGLSVNLTSSTGAGASVPASGNKVAGYFAAESKYGGGNVWAINSLLLIDAGANAIGGAQVAEFDLANYSGTNFGDGADIATLAQPGVFGAQFTGNSLNRATAAIVILGNIYSTTQPMWNNGIAASGTSIRQRFLWDNTSSITAFDISGVSHTYGIDFRGSSSVAGSGGYQTLYTGAAIRFGSQNAVAWRNASDSADLTMLQADSSNNLRVGATSTGVMLQGTALGFYGTIPISQPTVSGSKGGNAALTSLLVALATLGLVVDTTT